MNLSSFELEGTLPEYLDQGAVSPLHRFRPLTEWLDARYAVGLDPYSKYTATKIGPSIVSYLRKGDRIEGVNFASQDYLNFSSHLEVASAAKDAIDLFGVHSAGSSVLMGITSNAHELETKISEFVGYSDTILFPTGWAAGYGIVRTLVRDSDHVVIDLLAHACLHEGARAATKNVHVFPHLSNEGAERRIRKIRQTDAKNAIVVLTESTFSMDSDVPNLAELQAICHKYEAILIVDCAHDLGAIGLTGHGYMGIQNMVGKFDVLMGSFSKTFASNGGFVSSNARELKLGIRYTCGPQAFSNALSPVNAAVISKCFDLVSSAEGNLLREMLMRNIRLMRGLLNENGFVVLGKESAIVPVILGDNALSRLATKFALEGGAIVNLVEYPGVSKNTCRWRLQVQAQHTPSQIKSFVELACSARDKAHTALGK